MKKKTLSVAAAALAAVMLATGCSQTASSVASSVAASSEIASSVADEVASLNSLGDKKSVSKETILATEPDLILGKGPLMFTESSIGTVQSYQELGIPVYTELASASTDQALDNIVEDVRNIGEIFNVQETANAYADEWRAPEGSAHGWLRRWHLRGLQFQDEQLYAECPEC